MLKVRWRNKTDALSIEFDAASTKDAIKILGELSDVFDECRCGACDGMDVRFNHRESSGYHFYEVQCQNPQCRAKLAFGETKADHRLFKKRKDNSGNWLPNGGWTKFAPSANGGQNADYAADNF